MRLDGLIHAWAARAPAAVAIMAPGRAPLAYRDLSEFILQTGRSLRALGLGPRDRVALVLPNGPEMAAAVLSVAASAACAPLDPAYRAHEYGRLLARLGPAAVVVPADPSPEGSESPAVLVARKLGIPIIELVSLPTAAAGLFTLRAERRAAPVADAPARSDDVALILPTSGTTATPKLVPLSHANLCASARAVARALALEPGDRCLNVMPLFHIHGLVGPLFASLSAGASVVCTAGLHAPSFLSWLEAHRPTWYSAVPAMHHAILAHAARRPDPGGRPSLRLIRSSSAPLPASAREALERRFHVPVIEAYGMTEAAHQISSDPLPPRERRPGAVGVSTGPEIAILDATGQPVAPGRRGEIAIRGAGVTAGYLDDPDANAQAFVDGWFRTGDEGVVDADGYVFITGRLKEAINRGGEKIAPREVEDALLAHPAVAEAVAFPAPHAELGEEVAVAVVLRDDAVATARDLRAFAAARLAHFKVPGPVLFVPALPRSPTGKLQRLALAGTLGLTATGDAGVHARPAFVTPRTPLERELGELWTQVLELGAVGVHDAFFQAGGDSLLAAQLLARVKDRFEVDVPFHVFFEAPTVAALARYVVAERESPRWTAALRLRASLGEAPAPLSFAQERPWFFDQLNPGNPANNRPVALRLTGPLDAAALARSLEEIVRRHAVLRATFPAVDGQPVQQPGAPRALALPVVDLRGMAAVEREAAARREAAAASRLPFDLTRGPMVRATLFRLDEREHVLLVVLHQMVVDGWSANVLVRELAALYGAFATGRGSPLPDLPVQYADVATWQRKWLPGDTLARCLAYWTERLAGAPPTLPLPTDRPRPARPTFRGARETLALPVPLADALRGLSREENTTLFMTLFAAFQVVLHRYTGREDLVVGVPVAGRPHVEAEGLIGCFMNTLALRTDLTGAPTFRALLGRVRTVARDAFAHQDLSMAQLVQALAPERDASYTPLVQVVFNLEHFPDPPERAAEVALEEFVFDPGVAPAELLVEVIESRAELSCVVTYTTDLYDAGTIQRLLGHFRTVLESAVVDPDRPIATMPLLTEGERREIVADHETAPFPQDRCLHELFAAQAARVPDAVAVTCGEDRVTFGELNRRANRLAHHLRARGVGREARVGICLERSLDLVVAVLGILKAGGAYVPLDPTYPPERLAFVLEDGRCAALVTRARLLPLLRGHEAAAICLDTAREALERERDDDPVSGVTPDNLACVVYTSGSTGRPKGVLAVHRGLVNLHACWWRTYPFAPDDVWGQRSSISILDFLQELLTALLDGLPAALMPDEAMGDPVRLLRTLAAQGVTRVMIVPSLLRAWLDVFPDLSREIPTLRVLSVGGEPFPRELYRRAQERLPHCLVLQGYGMTEASAKSTWCEPRAMSAATASVPIGRPIANVEAYVLDRNLEPMPVGVPGELYIGGAGLTRGYDHRPDATAERFVPHPFGPPGARLYRTGDLVRRLPDGTLDCLGRTDHQVKVRGMRVEPGEVEATLERHPAVRQAAVMVREDGPLAGSLIAYVVVDPAAGLTAETTRGFARSLLPDYLLPSAFVLLGAFPLLPNGKVNRAALPVPDGTRPALQAAFVAPRTPMEEALAEIWCVVLGLDRVGVHDNFFDLGGHSLLATRIVARVNRRLETGLSVRSLLEAPTIAQLAAVIVERGGAAAAPAELDRVLTELERREPRAG